MKTRAHNAHTVGPPANHRGEDDLAPGDQLQVAFGRMIGLTLVAVTLLLGGGILLILAGAILLRFLYGG